MAAAESGHTSLAEAATLAPPKPWSAGYHGTMHHDARFWPKAIGTVAWQENVASPEPSIFWVSIFAFSTSTPPGEWWMVDGGSHPRLRTGRLDRPREQRYVCTLTQDYQIRRRIARPNNRPGGWAASCFLRHSAFDIRCYSGPIGLAKPHRCATVMEWERRHGQRGAGTLMTFSVVPPHHPSRRPACRPDWTRRSAA